MQQRSNIMRAIFRFVEHTLAAMVKGFFFTGIAAAIVSFLILVLATPGHHLVMSLATVFAIVLSVLAAILGSAVALIYRLSHISEARHAIQRYTSAHGNQPTTSK
jgi:putative flippase GtrA